LHADHLSGSSKIAAKYNSDLVLSAYENYHTTELSDFDVQRVKMVKGGENFKVGSEFEIKAIHTPGHTQGSISYILNIAKQGNDPSFNNGSNDPNHRSILYLFAGDTIFVNGVGRPDLHNKAKEYTSLLYQTYRNYILDLPDSVLLLPSHFSESFDHGKVVSNTIGTVRRKLANISGSSDDFADYVSSNIPPQPLNYEKIVKLNEKLVFCDQVYFRDLEAGPNSCGIKT
jgi:glyoxylase-like metal-dependent hydrolase (beta-lactamase superfamily II)